jgi:hypothetical protein
MVKDVAKWLLRSSSVDVDLPLHGFGFEVRRSVFLPMVYRKINRLLYFRRMLELVKGVPGDVVECGVLYGESLLFLSFLLADDHQERKLWGFDSFEPLSQGTAVDKATLPRRLKHLSGVKVGIESVERLLVDSGLSPDFVTSQVTLVKGYFEETLPKFTSEAVALLHIDVDLAESYKCVLEELYPRVPSGGVILFDEFMGTKEYAFFPGAQHAIAEYLGNRRSLIQRDASTGKYYYIKP